MVDAIMYESDGYVVLSSDRDDEELLTAEELLTKLTTVLTQDPDAVPQEAKDLEIAAQAQYALDNCCELDLGPGSYLQWYAVRFEK
ncbi:MAG: chlororespiratory reduction protein 7 [Cyanobacteria bacterium P01_H01_bin.15]